LKKRLLNTQHVLLLILISLVFSCQEKNNPRPISYPRIYLPSHEYNIFDSAHCNYSFKKPIYSSLKIEELYTQNKPCWYNLYFEPFDATLHISYHEYTNSNGFDSLYEDTRKLVYKHIVKADDIEEIEVTNKDSSMSGIIYKLKGNTATNLNFYLCDNQSRYFRGALYFNYKTNPDSIAPIYSHLSEDVMELISSFKWK
jgi:gliding motility-associated lipoprotein GldD